MALTQTQKILGRFATALGLVSIYTGLIKTELIEEDSWFQGAAWLVMSLISIIYYNEGLTTPTGTGYMLRWNSLVYNAFLNKNYIPLTNKTIITPDAFTIFMWLYLIVDAIWIILSVFTRIVINNKALRVANVFRAWAYITLLISFIDFILVILLAIDFRFCKHAYGVDSGVCVNIIIPVLVIAAKGFTLWIVNVSFAFALIITAKELAKQSTVQDRILTLDRQIPRATIQAPPLSNPYFNRNGTNETPNSPVGNYWDSQQKHNMQNSPAPPPMNSGYPLNLQPQPNYYANRY